MSTFSVWPDTVSYQLLHWSNTDPTSAAFIFRSDDPNNPRLTLTRRDVFTFGSRYAAILKRKGVQHGDIVCNTLPNSPERLLTDFGIMLAGATTLNGMVFLADGSDFLGSVRKAGCSTIITDPQQACSAMTILQEKLVFCEDQEAVECPDVPTLKHVLRVTCRASEDGTKPLLEELKKEDSHYVAEEVRPSDVAFIMTTSGSTGFSKLVPRTHAMLLDMGRRISEAIGREDGDVVFNDRSLGWIIGAPTIYFVYGDVRVLTDMSVTSTDPLALAWRSVWEEGVTVAMFVALHMSSTLNRPELWQDKGKIRRIFTGGQPIRKHHLRVLDTAAHSLCILYGSTEAGFVTSLVVREQDQDTFQDGDSGVPGQHFEVKLLDDNQQEIKEEGKTGEIVIRGHGVFTGYMRTEHQEHQGDIFTHDGFFRTSDIGFWNSQRHLFVVCRKSNAITHGAFIVYPGWLEARIEKCPGVQSIIVVPVPDPTIYHELCACVVTEKGVKVNEEDVREFCKSLFLVSDKAEISTVPRFYVFFDSFPTTATGKVDRRAIKDLALQKLGLLDSTITPNGGS